MLELTKKVLSAVSFDEKLFEKELHKALKRLSTVEIQILKNWCYQHFSGYAPLLQRSFAV